MLTTAIRLADEDTGALIGNGVVTAFAVLWLLFILVAGWKMYVKAGQAGWTSIIPIIQWLAMLKIAHRPLWWIILFFIPIVNIFVWIVVMLDLAKAFGKGIGMALLLMIFTPIAYLILGFGSAQYQLQKDPLFG